jgi:hypothetical protein
MSRRLEGGFDRSTACDASRTADGGVSGGPEVLRIYSDPAGAAHVMREVVARPKLSAQLLEDGNGRWHVIVRGEGAHERVLARVLDLVLRFIDEGRLEFATVEFSGRSITVGRQAASLAAA